mmetsp:Transcript_30432/g.78935  ORF Transcript_30432/g.78935 Transcript_30432/m.78935 type:complete len:190 (+) Transcript_30432:176-745(+)
MHAVSRDTSSFPRPCIYMQLAAEHKFKDDRPTRAFAPMEVGASAANGVNEDDSEEEEEEEEDQPQEVRLVPLGVEGEPLSAALDSLFQALSECAALNPDDDCDDGEDDEGESDDGGAALLLAASQGAEGFVDTQAILNGATPAQLAMLERYDAMLDASAVETGVGALQMDNGDGRFDDPDEELDDMTHS